MDRKKGAEVVREKKNHTAMMESNGWLENDSLCQAIPEAPGESRLQAESQLDQYSVQDPTDNGGSKLDDIDAPKQIQTDLETIVQTRFNAQGKMMNVPSHKKNMERRVNQLNYTTQLLTKKVTGVTFYLRDIQGSKHHRAPFSTVGGSTTKTL